MSKNLRATKLGENLLVLIKKAFIIIVISDPGVAEKEKVSASTGSILLLTYITVINVERVFRGYRRVLPEISLEICLRFHLCDIVQY